MSSAFTGQIPRTVDPNMSITTKEQALDLEKAFDKAWGPLDGPVVTEPEPKPAETEPPPAETPPPEPEEPSTETATGKEVPQTTPPDQKSLGTSAEPPPIKEAAPTAHPDDEVDEELDQMRLHPDSRPETVADFRKLRGMLKAERKVTKELRDRVQKNDQELVSLRVSRPVSDPTVQTELESLRDFKTKHQIFDDSGYQANYEQPIRVLFDDVLKDVKSMSPDKEAAETWEKEMRAAGPDRVDRNYWNEGVISLCQDPLHKERLVRKVNLLLEAKEKRDEFRTTMQAEPDAYEKFRQQQAVDYWALFGKEAEDEATKIIPNLGEWASPKDLALAKSTTERTAWETHNKTQKEYEDKFKEYLTDAATQGPRGMTRVAVQAVLAEKYRRDNEGLSARVKKLEAELRSAQDELTKISSARSRVNHGTPSSTSTASNAPAPKRKIGQSADDAFSDYFDRGIR